MTQFNNLLCNSSFKWTNDDGFWYNDYPDCQLRHQNKNYATPSDPSYAEDIDPNVFPNSRNYPLVINMTAKTTASGGGNTSIGIQFNKENGARYTAGLTFYDLPGTFSSQAWVVSVFGKTTNTKAEPKYADGSIISLSYNQYIPIQVKFDSPNTDHFSLSLDGQLVNSAWPFADGDTATISRIGAYTNFGNFTADFYELELNGQPYTP